MGTCQTQVGGNVKKVVLKERILSTIFHSSSTSEEVVKGIYGHVLKVAGIEKSGIKSLPTFYCAQDTYDLVFNMFIVWITSKRLGEDAFLSWPMYGFEIDDTIPPRIVTFDETKIVYG